MTKLDELSTQIDDLIKGEQDTAKLQNLAKMKTSIDEAKKEEEALLNKHAELRENYKNLILTTPAIQNAGQKDGGYTPPKQAPSFEDFFSKKVSELEKGNK